MSEPAQQILIGKPIRTPRTDVERINWMASHNLRIGIGIDRFTTDVVVNNRKLYRGRNLREAVDRAMDAEHENENEAQ